MLVSGMSPASSSAHGYRRMRCPYIEIPGDIYSGNSKDSSIQYSLFSPHGNVDILDIPDEGMEGMIYITQRIAAPRVTASAHRLVTFGLARRVSTPLRCRCTIPQEPDIEEVRRSLPVKVRHISKAADLSMNCRWSFQGMLANLFCRPHYSESLEMLEISPPIPA